MEQKYKNMHGNDKQQIRLKVTSAELKRDKESRQGPCVFNHNFTVFKINLKQIWLKKKN